MAESENRFIVIEGLDGSGKSTQIEYLLDYFKKRNSPVEYLHFPITDDRYFGDLIARFLRGDLGPLESVHPRLVALIFAGNRYDSAEMIRKWLKEGITVIADRYVYSNIAFQCAKLEDESARNELRQWILDLEYDHYGIPRPDINIFLDVPFEFTTRKLTSDRNGEDRRYLNGKRDIHEQDLDFQRKVREMYQGLLSKDPAVRILECTDTQGGMLAPAEIFRRIQTLLFTE